MYVIISKSLVLFTEIFCFGSYLLEFRLSNKLQHFDCGEKLLLSRLPDGHKARHAHSTFCSGQDNTHIAVEFPVSVLGNDIPVDKQVKWDFISGAIIEPINAAVEG